MSFSLTNNLIINKEVKNGNMKTAFINANINPEMNLNPQME